MHVSKLILATLLCLLLITTNSLINKVYASIAIPDLPEPVSNNAVASVLTSQGPVWVSLMGLTEPKTYAQVHNKVWVLKLAATDPQWQKVTPVPSSLTPTGRLASVAVGVRGQVYVFGGYTVDSEHNEISSPDNFRYDVLTDRYTAIAPTPVAVDDAIALVYQDRYVYLISGWHNDGNVNLVQVYDVQNDTWQQASPFLGVPVFGHAGAMIGNTMVVCDGVAVAAHTDKRRTFEMESACYLGTVDANQTTKIDWRKLRHPTGIGRYRMASGANNEFMMFAGGSTNPYNYNGMGYNGQPSEPDPKLWIFHPDTMSWEVQNAQASTMDHRGLIFQHGRFWVIGGMTDKQSVLKRVTPYTVR